MLKRFKRKISGIVMILSIIILLFGAVKSSDTFIVLGLGILFISNLIDTIIDMTEGKEDLKKNNLITKEKIYEKINIDSILTNSYILIIMVVFCREINRNYKEINQLRDAGETDGILKLHESNNIMFCLILLTFAIILINIYKMIKFKDVVYVDGIFLGNCKYITFKEIKKVEVKKALWNSRKALYISNDKGINILKCKNEDYISIKKLIRRNKKIQIIESF
ncbi:MAG: hypothetical protein ACRCVJ_06810 [Clostridium sp.]|uniref:hypothetical protein n=1 Tax=Clostridium sp. TaxID=1506 RepID=UPI003F32EEFF